ncbi:unnamed protein product [Miscanthus lutarioriparius]|uniref:Uncharacterized protein n=1 Tax=Miscanthus lutarioriparius TaxID=422564 RepID=A0A811QS50_9POAL|nr:unnamed protein product [Miscanthus lutarioriparius]
MARGSGIRRRSRWMRRGGKMPGAGVAVMKPHGGGVVKHAGRGIRRRSGDGSLGQVVNAGSADSEVEQASSTDSASEGWIYVRGHRIKKAGLHIDCHGNVYVPDSEAEESGTEEPEACGLDVTAGMDLAVDLTPKVHDAVGVERVPEGDAVGAAVVDQVPDMAAGHARDTVFNKLESKIQNPFLFDRGAAVVKQQRQTF